MRAPSNADVLDLWERGFRLHAVDRGLLALGVAFPETPYESLADWPLGRRNQALAELRCSCFGPGLQGWTSCTQCGEKLEFQMDGRTLIEPAGDRERGPRESIFVKGHSFRLPTSRDLARAAQESDSRVAAIRLLEACRLETGDAPPWSEEDIEDVGERMALADPMAETRLTLHCPNCSHQWEEPLDLAIFV